MDVEGCGRLSVLDDLLEIVWFCVYKLGGSLAGEMNVSFVAVVGASASALDLCVGRQKGLCGSCRSCVTSMHYIKWDTHV